MAGAEWLALPCKHIPDRYEQLVLILLGVFVGQESMLLITLPIFMPIVLRFGIDPVWGCRRR